MMNYLKGGAALCALLLAMPAAHAFEKGLDTAATHATEDFLQSTNNLSDLPSAATARTNLGDLRRGASTNPTSGYFYTETTGSDSNDCLAVTVTGGHGPCLTIQYTLAMAMLTDARSNHLHIKLGDGTWEEPVTISGPMTGGFASTNWLYSLNSPMVVLEGNGSANTEIAGPGLYAGNYYCYGIFVATGARAAIKDLSVRGDTTDCNGLGTSDLFVQDASLYIVSDVKLKGATGNWVSMEEKALLYVSAGVGGTPALTVTGNALNGFNIDSGSTFSSDSEIIVDGPSTLSGGCFISLDSNSTFKSIITNPAFTSGETVNARRFCIAGLSTLIIDHPPAAWPGTSQGVASNGSRYETASTDSDTCLGTDAVCNDARVPTGLGTGGVAVMAGSSSVYGGAVEITAGSSAATSGIIYIGFPYELNKGICTPSLQDGSGTWEAHAHVRIAGYTDSLGLTVYWNNDGVALTDTQTYFVDYVCNTTK